MLNPETDTAFRLALAMGAQTNEFALGSLVILSEPHNLDGESFSDLRIDLENFKKGKLLPGSTFGATCKLLANAGLITPVSFGTQIPFRITELGLAAKDAYQQYEDLLMEPYIAHGVESLKDMMSEEDAELASRNLLFGSIEGDVLGFRAYERGIKVGRGFNLFEIFQTAHLRYRRDLGFYKFPAIQAILAEQSNPGKLATLFRLSRSVSLPPSLHELPEGSPFISDFAREGLKKRELIEGEGDRIAITRLGEASLQAFLGYYSILKDPLLASIQG